MHALPPLAIEHLAFVVHHAAFRILSHAAAAERMGRCRFRAHVRRGQRALDVARADGLRRLGQGLIDAGIDGLVGHAGPVDLGAAVIER